MKQIDYFLYLSSITWKGKLYRRLFVYPAIRRECGARVLDIGCGLGLFLSVMKSGTGVDINSFCVEHCNSIGLDTRVMKKDRLPFSDNEVFDSLVLDNVLEHIADPTLLLNECKRLMSGSSNLIILVPGAKGYKRDSDHKVFYNFEILCKLAAQHGFTMVTKKSLPLPFLQNILSSFCFFVIFKKA